MKSITHLLLAVIFMTVGFSHAALPTVRTLAATNVTSSSVRLNGQIAVTDSAILERRIEWLVGYSGGTDFTNWTASVTTSGFDFSLNLSGLPASTNIGFRAWARNSSGWGWGGIQQVLTSAPAAVPPTVATLSASFPLPSRVRLSGQIQSNGGASVTLSRLYFSTFSASGPWDSIDRTPDGSGVFYADFQGLAQGTVVHFYAYAQNSAGGGQGSTLSVQIPILGPSIETTSAVADSTNRAMRLGGRILSNNGNPVTETRVFWSLNNSPLWDSQTVSLNGDGTFSTLVRVPWNTSISFYAQGTTSAGTRSGETLTTTAAAFAPDSPTALFPEAKHQTSIQARGRVQPGSYDGGAAIQDADVWWVEGDTPEAWPAEPDAEHIVYSAQFTGNGFFSALVNGLSPGTLYRFRMRVVNLAGIPSAWSAEAVAFTFDPLGFVPSLSGAVVWNDDDTSDPQVHGDADGVPELGETGLMRFTVSNTGDATGSGTLAWMPPSDPKLILMSPSSRSVEALDPGLTTEVSFLVTIRSDSVAGAGLSISLRFSAPELSPPVTRDLAASIVPQGASAVSIMPETSLSAGEGDLCLSFPAWALAEWMPQQSAALGSGWQDVTAPATEVDGIIKYTLPLAAPRGFFRMKRRH